MVQTGRWPGLNTSCLILKCLHNTANLLNLILTSQSMWNDLHTFYSLSITQEGNLGFFKSCFLERFIHFYTILPQLSSSVFRSGQTSSWFGTLRSLMASMRSHCLLMPSGYPMLSWLNCKKLLKECPQNIFIFGNTRL